MNDVTVHALTVRGTPSADEIAALLALLRRSRTPPHPDSIATWRDNRRAALVSAALVSAALPRPVCGRGQRRSA